jgi:hypothetical protein
VREEARLKVKGSATYPFASEVVSTAIASAGAKALALRSRGVLSTVGDVITAIGP